MTSTPEHRYVAGLELRASGEGKPLVLAGIAVPYGSRANIGRFTEEFRAGSLKPVDGGVILNVAHDRTRPLARSPNTMRWIDGADALRIEATLPDTAEARDTAELVKTGVLPGLSLDFFCLKDEWRGTHRIITEGLVQAVSVVDRPAYDGAVLEARWRAVEAIRAPAWVPGL
ncbi:MAG: HK97 family phage prohead protease [Alphaproteobacteria bacterium]|nr:HK97 family phage prohead protease [Alphaproteobacteria bacterium]